LIEQLELGAILLRIFLLVNQVKRNFTPRSKVNFLSMTKTNCKAQIRRSKESKSLFSPNEILKSCLKCESCAKIIDGAGKGCHALLPDPALAAEAARAARFKKSVI